jgi:hypothetical protein
MPCTMFLFSLSVAENACCHIPCASGQIRETSVQVLVCTCLKQYETLLQPHFYFCYGPHMCREMKHLRFQEVMVVSVAVEQFPLYFLFFPLSLFQQKQWLSTLSPS